MDYKGILADFGIQTRLGKCPLSVEFAHLNSENSQDFEEEFSFLANMGETPMMKWLNSVRAKNRLEGGDEMIFDVLVEIYKKLDKIEKKLNDEKSSLIPLPYSARLAFLGHEALCLHESQSFFQNLDSQNSLDSEKLDSQKLNSENSNSQMQDFQNLNSQTPNSQKLDSQIIYLRLYLPVFPERHIGFFAQILTPQIARITRLHPKDRASFDSFVADCERNMILDNKSLREQ